MTTNLQTISLYNLNAVRQPGGTGVQTSSVASLLAISHSIEETVIRHGMDAIFFAGFQRFSAFLPQANRFRQLAARCKKVFVFGEADSAIPEIPNLEYISLSAGAPLIQEWFMIFSHPRFNIALLTREIGGSAFTVRESRFGRGKLYQGLLTLEDSIVQPAAALLHKALNLPAPAFAPPPIEPAQPINTYINRFSEYMENTQSQLSALYGNLTERTATLERLEEIVRTMVSRRAWDDSLQILEGKTSDSEEPQRRNLTILFTDIQNFTPLFERADSRAMTQLLNRYFNLLAVITYEFHGDIDKFLGDGMMAFFINPSDAIQAAAQMQRQLEQFNKQQAAHLDIQVNTRIGIASGECLVARLGSASRREITILGNAVNLASRLQALAPINGIAMDETTYRAIGSPALYSGRDVQIKGRGYERMYAVEFHNLPEA